MVNILLDYYDINNPWLFDTLKNYIKPQYKVAIIAFSFRDNRVKNLMDWNALYGKNGGKYYGGLVNALMTYGIDEDNIEFLNYFVDNKETAARKIRSADILYFLGGLPDRMYERLREFDLVDIIMKHDGITMGYSAGAVIQLTEYHLSPDDDYPVFDYYKGLSLLRDFYVEVHYENHEAKKGPYNNQIQGNHHPAKDDILQVE